MDGTTALPASAPLGQAGMPLDLLARAVWAMRGWLLLATVLLYGAGAALILLWPRSYVAEAVVAPAETTGIATSSLLSPAPLLQGAGLLDNGPTGNFAIYLGALRSPEATALLVRETGLLGFLTARREEFPLGPLRRWFDLRIAADQDDAQDWLETHLDATQTLNSVTWTVALKHRDREAALDMLRRLHAYAESKVRADLAQLARRRIAAVARRLSTEPDVYLRGTLYDLLGQHQRVDLVAEADEAVAARLVSAPSVEIRPSVPNRPLLLLLLAVTAPLATTFAAASLALLRRPSC